MELEILLDLGLELLKFIHNIEQYIPVTISPRSGYGLCVVRYIDLKGNNNEHRVMTFQKPVVRYIDLKGNNNLSEQQDYWEDVVRYIDLKGNNNAVVATPFV